ncbi:alpha/beta fold hydrolase [Paenibacillus apiarius]|uniref:prolyl aminopeptidase n=1 Tax=Paenibacillus apiarius TaxID=46240 RepID=A0ABT4DWF1_9BACL|nr:alpha/beta hydrolase [Paenibacillus apiarius]MCY9517668.1 alpha/beta hydrolase [Paenibacillus apiarius]MCY9521679.1 alpha/beta hydrolase [Paenibacillus apiarius]MCY9555357.1 alpha/beta hydrolase [Paenibacillus apiarius]MCY9561237.1 alpha/beta hydrolase [Paenibacillus apiarius]MCY9686380.1 alpha/beta hydrolase [Paenibacillus apiarius]
MEAIIALMIVGGIFMLIAGLALLVQFKKQKTASRIRMALGHNGMDCREYVTIGGISQYLHHRGTDVDHPVLLFLHGGPGSPMLPFAQEFQIPWEKRVTVVHWDQRSSGKTYFNNCPKQVDPTTTVEQAIQDTYEVVEYLKCKYNKKKIIIMGHSWGSVLGSLFVKQYPELVQAYIGVGQVINMIDNERIGYEKALKSAKAAGNDKDYQALLRLEPYPPLEFSDDMPKKLARVRRYQSKYNLAAGATFDLVVSGLCSPFYTLRDVRCFFRTGIASEGQRQIMKFLMESFDLPSLGTAYEIPVFYIQGERDWQTPYPLAKEFFPKITAPLKLFYSIPDAGHIPMIDQKEKFNEALFDILERIE